MSALCNDPDSCSSDDTGLYSDNYSMPNPNPTERKGVRHILKPFGTLPYMELPYLLSIYEVFAKYSKCLLSLSKIFG